MTVYNHFVRFPRHSLRHSGPGGSRTTAATTSLLKPAGRYPLGLSPAAMRRAGGVLATAAVCAAVLAALVPSPNRERRLRSLAPRHPGTPASAGKRAKAVAARGTMVHNLLIRFAGHSLRHLSQGSGQTSALPGSRPVAEGRPSRRRYLCSAVAKGAGGALAAAAVWFVTLWLLAALLPALWGWHPVLIYGGSMGDALPPGSVAVLKTVSADQIENGDIIAIGRQSGTPFIHRVKGIESVDGTRMATVRGDANGSDDPTPVALAGTGDRLVYHVPWAGYILWALKSPEHLSATAVATLAVWVAVLLRKAPWPGPASKGSQA